jgi:hypothetical protein
MTGSGQAVRYPDLVTKVQAATLFLIALLIHHRSHVQDGTWDVTLSIARYCEGDWAKGGGGGAGGDCAGDDFAGGFGGLRGWSEFVWAKGRDDIFFLMSCSAACSAAMFWAICSCLTTTCSKLRRIAARSRAMGSSCMNSGGVAAAADAGV